jgi:hypothetical protein
LQKNDAQASLAGFFCNQSFCLKSTNLVYFIRANQWNPWFFFDRWGLLRGLTPPGSPSVIGGQELPRESLRLHDII